MDNKNWLTAHGLTPAKGGIVAVLALILVVVLFMQFGGPSASTSRPARRAGPGRAAATSAPQHAGPQSSSAADLLAASTATPWPTLDITKIVEFDPLQLPRRVAAKIRAEKEKQEREAQKTRVLTSQKAKEQAERAAALATLRQSGVELIVESNGQVVAFVGTRSVRIGDTISGLKVTAIRPDGIVLSDVH